MSGVAVRPPYGQHPRIFIWGLLEARLQHADLMILAGLNEGTWPALPTPDTWLAPRIRAELGLTSLEWSIGLSAHDLATAIGKYGGGSCRDRMWPSQSTPVVGASFTKKNRTNQK